MKQRKVTTNQSSRETKVKKILNCLKYRPEGANPKTISRETGINVNTVKAILPEMPQIVKPMRGIYKVVSEGDGTPQSPHLSDLRSWNFHNCILTGPAVRDMDDRFDFNIVSMHVSATNGKATCRLSTDHPLNVSSLAFVAGFFAELIDCSWDDIEISSVEFNKDYRDLRLDGANSLSIDGLVTQFKLYQKSIGLRIEHKTKVPLTMEGIVSMLSQNPLSTDTLTKLDALGDRIESLTHAVQTHQHSLLKMVAQ